MPQVLARFDCGHEKVVDVDVDSEVKIPAQVRGLGKCPECQGAGEMIAISGIAPQPGGRDVVLDTVHMMPRV